MTFLSSIALSDGVSVQGRHTMTTPRVVLEPIKAVPVNIFI